MMECIFTLDYEIYGNGQGDLRELVYEPTRRLQQLFLRAGVKFVNFVEALEFEQIQRIGTDAAIADVCDQIRELYHDGHEIALHLHPQWANARFDGSHWHLDYSEYNLCTLSPERICLIVDCGLAWLREVLGEPGYVPHSFRAGNWLFQPTHAAAKVLASRGVRIDSSVFKGGVQNQHRLDYRAALKNAWYWRFGEDVNQPDPKGQMVELPIHTQMVPFWRMLTSKRVGLHQKPHTAPLQVNAKSPRSHRRMSPLRDYLRLRYPLKFDFCRMTLPELTAMMEAAIAEDRSSPEVFKPLVAIGHSKDLVDFDTVEAFLGWLQQRSIPVTTLASACHRCQPTANRPQSVLL